MEALTLGELYLVLEGHAGDVNCTAWSPTAKDTFCSCSGDKKIRVWKVEDNSSNTKPSPVETVLAHRFYINSCAYNPSGDLFATTSSDDTIKLWSTASWACLGEWGWVCLLDGVGVSDGWGGWRASIALPCTLY